MAAGVVAVLVVIETRAGNAAAREQLKTFRERPRRDEGAIEIANTILAAQQQRHGIEHRLVGMEAVERARAAEVLIADFGAEPAREAIADENLGGAIRTVGCRRTEKIESRVARIRVSDLPRDIVRIIRDAGADAEVPTIARRLRVRRDSQKKQSQTCRVTKNVVHEGFLDG